MWHKNCPLGMLAFWFVPKLTNDGVTSWQRIRRFSLPWIFEVLFSLWFIRNTLVRRLPWRELRRWSRWQFGRSYATYAATKFCCMSFVRGGKCTVECICSVVVGYSIPFKCCNPLPLPASSSSSSPPGFCFIKITVVHFECSHASVGGVDIVNTEDNKIKIEVIILSFFIHIPVSTTT